MITATKGKWTSKRRREYFDYVRDTFFPRWDRERKWRIRGDARLSQVGIGATCNHESKTISIQEDCRSAIAVLLIIHEVSHAVTPRGEHGPSWQKRMMRVADKAAKLGLGVLGDMLREHVKFYREETDGCRRKQ